MEIDQSVICDLPACKYCGSSPVLWRADTHFAIRCPNDNCHGHETTSADTFPWDTLNAARLEWIEFNLLPCLRCGGSVRIVKTKLNIQGHQDQKFINCDSCAWEFSPAFILPDAELAFRWNDR